MSSYLSLPLSIMLNYTDFILESATLAHIEYPQWAMQVSLKSRKSVYKSLFHISRKLLTKINSLHRNIIFAESLHSTNARYDNVCALGTMIRIRSCLPQLSTWGRLSAPTVKCGREVLVYRQQTEGGKGRRRRTEVTEANT